MNLRRPTKSEHTFLWHTKRKKKKKYIFAEVGAWHEGNIMKGKWKLHNYSFFTVNFFCQHKMIWNCFQRWRILSFGECWTWTIYYRRNTCTVLQNAMEMSWIERYLCEAKMFRWESERSQFNSCFLRVKLKMLDWIILKCNFGPLKTRHKQWSLNGNFIL